MLPIYSDTETATVGVLVHEVNSERVNASRNVEVNRSSADVTVCILHCLYVPAYPSVSVCLSLASYPYHRYVHGRRRQASEPSHVMHTLVVIV